jgi:hypothetical protein
MTAAEYMVTFDGCPYRFGTGGVVAPTSTDADWPEATGTVPTLVVGGLVYPRGTIEERLRPIDGTVEVSGFNFTLHDPIAEAGPAAGYPVVTWLGTRKETVKTSTELASDIAATGNGTFSVAYGSDFPTGAQVVYVEHEALYCSGRSGGTFTINASPSGRARYGSRAVAHVRDPSNSFAPTVYKDFPGFERRRVVLWHIDAAQVARPIWRGYCQRAPRLTSGNDPSAGALYEFQCESAAQVELAQPVGMPASITRPRGFNSDAIVATVMPTRRAASPTHHGQSSDQTTVDDPINDTLADALAQTSRRLLESLGGPDAGYQVTLAHEEGRVVLRVVSAAANGSPIYGGLRIRGTGINASATNNDNDLAGNAHTQVFAVDGGEYSPECLVFVELNTPSQPFPIASGAGFPTSWAAVTVDDTTNRTSVQTMLRGELAPGAWLVLSPDPGASSPVDTTAAPFFVGVVAIEGDASQSTLWNDGARTLTLERAIPLTLTTRVSTSHWVHGIEHGLFDRAALGSFADPRNWDWTAVDAVVAATSGASSPRVWYFDGAKKLGDVIRDACALDGCGVAVRASRLCVIPFAPPLPNTPVAATFDADDDFVGKPSWTTFPDGIANVVSVESERLKIVVRDQRSISRNGPGREVKLSLTGIEDARLIAGVNPFEIARTILSRVLGIWSIPVALARFTVSIASLHAVFVGDYVGVTDWLMPDGTGGRGLADVTCQVIGRAVDLGASTIAFEAIIYDHGNLAAYAPCVRVAALNPARTVVTVATSYLGATLGTGESDTPVATLTDYAGSDRSDYAGTAGDGGTGFFAAGDKVTLVLRDSTTLTTEDATVLSVDTAAKTITLTGAVAASWATALAASAVVDVVYSDYDTSGLQAAQKGYAFVCDYLAPYFIGGSSDPAQTWSP